MEKYKVSIIIPIYNVEKYIHRCVNSILEQTYSNIEIILVNDGSTDNCPKVCDIYEKKDNRIKVIHKNNGGLSSARNKGLDIATGEYIAFVDGDDYIHKNMIGELTNVAENNEVDIVHCNFEMVDEEGNIIKCKNRTYKEEKTLNSYETICGHVIDYKVKVMAWNKLYKSELFKNLRFEEGYVYEDELLFPKIISKSNKNIILNKKLYFYVYAPQSITKGDITINKIISKKYLINFFEEFYLEKYPELMRHIYMLICLICIDCIKQIKVSKNLNDKDKEIRYFRNEYLTFYVKMNKYKSNNYLPLKKEIYSFISYISLRLKDI